MTTDKNQPAQNAPKFDSYSINGDDFQEGDASDALQDLYDGCQLEIGTEYRLGVAEKTDPADFFDVDHLIEQMQERAYDVGGEFAEGYLTDLTDEQVRDLDGVVKAWLSSVKPSVTFFSVKGIQTFNVTREDIDDFHGQAGTGGSMTDQSEAQCSLPQRRRLPAPSVRETSAGTTP